MPIYLAIDCMGGDHGLKTTLPAALGFLRRVDDVHLLLVGDAAAINAVIDAVNELVLGPAEYVLVAARER